MQKAITTSCKAFADLTLYELYNILRLRSEVFVVEQNCVFLEQDNKDQQCFHLSLFQDNSLAGYARLVPPGVAYKEMSIGRVITSPAHRGTGIGNTLMQVAVDLCHEKFGKGPIRIGAQLYAEKFYKRFGFEQSGDIYLEDGIEHIEMVKAT
jgi:ElaA protein